MTYPPLLMRKAKAAAYVDMSVAAFEREVLAGKLPQPILIGGKDHWDQRAIEKAIDVLTGVTNGWRNGSPLYGNTQA